MPAMDNGDCSATSRLCWELGQCEVPFQFVKLSMLWGEPPENALQGCGAAGRVLSEHELRVQRSLQRLNVPDWYKNNARPADQLGFLLKRGSDAGGAGSALGGRRTAGGWPGLGVKTTSLSSLPPGPSLRSPTTGVRLGSSPSPPPGTGTGSTFTRWSSSRLHSASSGATPSTSPCGSARSSFNHRQPYLGWRSQERLSGPLRTPAERLAQGLLPHIRQEQQQQHKDSNQLQSSPNLSEVRTSIKEVTSAIVHYVSSAGAGSGSDVRLAPSSPSPRGSTSRLCWVESSFVGSRPAETPQTPAELPSATVHQDLYLDLQKRGAHAHHGHGGSPCESRSNGPSPLSSSNSRTTPASAPAPAPAATPTPAAPTPVAPAPASSSSASRPSPGSTTMEDVLDSLLGLPPPSRSPSPGPSPGPPQAPGPPPGPGPGPGAPQAVRSCADLRPDPAESASDSLVVPISSDPMRRRSEGSVSVVATCLKEPGTGPQPSAPATVRRVSFDVAAGNEAGLVVHCRNTDCSNSAPAAEARLSYKMCHNCSHTYCSRECRRDHWERHRRTCLHSRVGALCRRVVSRVKDDAAQAAQLSQLARRGYLSQGRGVVKLFFSSPEVAEHFCGGGAVEPVYVRWGDLLPAEMGVSLYEDLVRMCRSYNPDTRLILFVVVDVVSEVPASGAVKWERQLVSRVSKIRLNLSVGGGSGGAPGSAPGPAPTSITRDSDNPETLILTSLPGPHGQRAREVSYCNIQRHLKQRGVSLRKHFPDVHHRLLEYVEGRCERFTPVTIYPVDAVSGKSFMCIIMPDSEPKRLELVPKDSSRVQTVDIGVELDAVEPGAAGVV